MKKIKLIRPLLGLTILTTAFVPLASCSNSDSQLTITFVAGENGTIYGGTSVKVDKGTLWKDVITPAAVAKADYIFDNWYNGDTVLTNDTKIESSITVTGKFIDLHAKTVSAPLYMANSENGTFESLGANVNIYHFNGSAMGYAKLADFYPNDCKFKLEESNHISTLTNNYNNDYHGKCTIDFSHQTITFDNLEQFMDFNDNSFGPMADLVAQGRNYFVESETKVKSFTKGDSYTIDLQKYNIKLVWYKDQGYIPYELLKDVLNDPVGIPIEYGTIKVDMPIQSFDYNGSGLYNMPAHNLNAEKQQLWLKLKNTVKSTSGDYYTKNYMEYCYNLFALTLDFRFGMTQRISRAKETQGQTIKYLNGGAYNILKPYHDKLVSLENDVSSSAIRQVMKENFDDGGHTAYMQLNAFSTKGFEFADAAGKEITYNSTISKKLSDERTNKSLNPTKGVGRWDVYTGSSNNDIAYLTFDNFYTGTMTAEESQMEKPRETLAGTDENNYTDDILRLTMFANNEIHKQGSKIQNLVIDLSQNIGGVGYVEHFVASWLCGGITEKIWNPKTNDYCEYTVGADVNCDGAFDENDTLPSNIKLFVITSTVSFSCGNILPCNIRDYKDGTTFMGHNSGGGPCIVDNYIQLGANSFVQYSGTHHLLRKDSTLENIISMDDGAGIDTGWEFDEYTNPDKFYDREAINSKIWGA